VRRPGLARLALVLALVAAVAAAVSAGVVRHRRLHRPLASFQVTGPGEWDPRVRWVDGGRLLVVSAGGYPAHAEAWSSEGRLAQRLDAGDFLQSAAPVGHLVALRHWAGQAFRVSLVSAVSGEVLREFERPENGAVVLTPRGDLVAFVDTESRIEVRSTKDGSIACRPVPCSLEPFSAVERTAQYTNPCFSRDGTLLALEFAGSCCVWAIPEGTIAATYSGACAGFRGNREVVVLGHRPSRLPHTGSLDALDLRGDLVQHVADIPERTGVRLSGDLLWIEGYGLPGRPAYELRSLETGEVRRAFSVDDVGDAYDVDASPAGDRIAFSYAGGRVAIWEIPP
jgi:hypothetical protein